MTSADRRQNPLGSAWRSVRIGLAALAGALFVEMRGTSVLPLLVLVLAWRLDSLAPPPASGRERWCARLLAGLLAAFAVAGKLSVDGDWIGYLVHTTVLSPALRGLVYAMTWLGLSFGIERAICLAGHWLDLVARPSSDGASHRMTWISAWAGILICWWPYLLCYWPGVLTPDSRSQLLQAMGRSGYEDTHPVTHTLLIKGLQALGSWMSGSSAGAIGTYTIVQMACLAGAMAYVVYRLRCAGVRLGILVPVAMLYALLPLHAMYSMTMWKNIPFACACVGLTFAVWDLSRSASSGQEKGALVRFAAFGVLSALLQKNGIAAVLPVAFTLPWLPGRRRARFLLAWALPILVLFAERRLCLSAGVAPSKDLVIAGLSIPVQQVARTVVDGGNISADQWADVDRIGFREDIAALYDRRRVDPLKVVVSGADSDAIRADALRYANLWMSIGRANPGSYLAAYVDQTCGYWYPAAPYSNIWQSFENRDLGVERTERSRSLPCTALSRLAAYSEFLPMLGALRSIGLQVWVAMFMAAYAYSRRRRDALACFLPVLGIWASLLVTAPIFAEVRYIYPLYLLVPWLVAAPLLDGKGVAKGENRGHGRR